MTQIHEHNSLSNRKHFWYVSDWRMLGVFVAVLGLFFASGSCGLIYQVVWTRKLVLLFGATAHAVGTVLFIFFLGLGVGSLWGGRIADRSHRPLFLYGLFEIIIGVWALGFILAVGWGEGLVAAVLRISGLSRGAGVALRVLMATVLLFVPVALMGTTLPLLARFVSRDAGVRGRRIGALYAMNTFGAVAGCFAAGFLLLPRFGYTRTTLLGAAINVSAGVIAVLMSRLLEKRSSGMNGKAACAEGSGTSPDGEDHMDAMHTAHAGKPSDAGSLSRKTLFVVIGAYAMLGCCGLALEVIWTRLLIMVFLGTTYAYTTMLTTLLCGIALGSAIASLRTDRMRAHALAFGIVLMLAAGACMLTLTLIAGLPPRIIALHQQYAADWPGIVRGIFFYSFFVLFLPTFLFGMSFPVAVKAVAGAGARLGRHVGILYGANTFGGVAGALAGGFLILPVFGAHDGVLLLSVLLGLSGAAAALSAPRTHWRKKSVFLLLGVGLFTIAAMFAPEDVSRALNVGYIPEDHHVIFYREGVEGTVAVSEPVDEMEGRNRVLWINRVQATASIERGVRMNRFQAALPLLFDRDPREVLFMCVGSGITCGALAQAGFDRIDAVEIAPEVLAAARCFAVDNLGVLDHPGVRFIVDDGRNFLLTTRNAYDLISFEPMPLALAGVSTFYSKEYYQLCLRRLRPGGLVSQWVPLHSMAPDVVRSLVRTFTAVFPEYCAWFVNADLFLIGSDQPLRIDFARAARRLSQPGLSEALAEVGYHDPHSVIASFLMDKRGMDAFVGDGEVMADDRPWAEFIAPKLVYARTVHQSIAQILPHLSSPSGHLVPDSITPEERAALERRVQSRAQDIQGVMAFYSGLTLDTTAAEAFMRALDIDPLNHNARHYLQIIFETQIPQWLRWQDYDRAEAMIMDAQRYLPDDPMPYAFLGDLHWARGETQEAAEAYQRHLDLGGNAARAREHTKMHHQHGESATAAH